MIDLLCDEKLVDFYKRLHMTKSQGMIIRNFNNQNGYVEKHLLNF
jgi:hypothetical protein